MAPALASALEGLVDYAGLFPPANADMDAAVTSHAAYRSGSDRALLGRFIVPLARLEEFAAAHARLPPEARPGWRLGVVARTDREGERDRIAAFHATQADVRVVSVEGRPATEDEFRRLVDAFPPSIELWVEIAPDDPDSDSRLAALRAAGRGAKLRTGGVTPQAFPSAPAVARFLGLARSLGVVFKATAGLHHPQCGDFPLTYAPDAPRGRMFGFLNLLLAAALAHGGAAPEAEIAALLGESDPQAFRPVGEAVTWRGHRFDAARLITVRRDLFRSFGSCSFTEPINGLRDLSWLR